MFILNWSRMCLTKAKHMPKSSALAWQKRITPAARGAGSHKQGMPLANLSSSTLSGETASFHGIQHKCFLKESFVYVGAGAGNRSRSKKLAIQPAMPSWIRQNDTTTG